MFELSAESSFSEFQFIPHEDENKQLFHVTNTFSTIEETIGCTNQMEIVQ